MSSGVPYWFQAISLLLNVAQTVALAYVTTRWKRVNGELELMRAPAADRDPRDRQPARRRRGK